MNLVWTRSKTVFFLRLEKKLPKTSSKKKAALKNLREHWDGREKHIRVKHEKLKKKCKQHHSRCVNDHGHWHRHRHLFSFICSRNRHTMEQKKVALGEMFIDESVLGIRIDYRFHASLHIFPPTFHSVKYYWLNRHYLQLEGSS